MSSPPLITCCTRSENSRFRRSALVLHRLVAILCLAAEFLLLQACEKISRHACQFISAGKFKHAEIQCVESGQGHELELVTHARQFGLELRQWSPPSIFFLQLKLGEQL